MTPLKELFKTPSGPPGSGTNPNGKNAAGDGGKAFLEWRQSIQTPTYSTF
jgi:hypothetical protein